MGAELGNLTLGGGDLYLNNVNVGSLKGDVEFNYVGELKEYKSQLSLGTIKVFRFGESASLKATIAEISTANFKIALGVTDSALSSSSWPAYDPTSYVEGSGSFDIMKFGGSKTVNTTSLRFEHTIPGTSNKVIIILYSCYPSCNWTLPFKEEDVTLQDIEFKALAVDTRDAGDQIGFVARQVL